MARGARTGRGPPVGKVHELGPLRVGVVAELAVVERPGPEPGVDGRGDGLAAGDERERKGHDGELDGHGGLPVVLDPPLSVAIAVDPEVLKKETQDLRWNPRVKHRNFHQNRLHMVRALHHCHHLPFAQSFLP